MRGNLQLHSGSYSNLPAVLSSLDKLLKLKGLDDGSVAHCYKICTGINLKFAF